MERKRVFKFGAILLVFLTIVSFTYNEEFVEFGNDNYYGWEFNTITLNREASNKRIKVKYFAARDYNGASVPERFAKWFQSKNVIAFSSAGYMTEWDLNNATPVGITVDNGRVVNRKVADFDALVVIYATGGVVVADINEGIKVKGIDKLLKVKNQRDRLQFLDWCKKNSATVFQTHLLAYKNKIRVANNASTTKSERRFLAVGKNDDNELQYVIINSPKETSLLDGSKKTLEYLHAMYDMNVTYMINLDTGGQNVFRGYLPNGEIYSTINNKGEKVYPFLGSVSYKESVNLLVFYWQ